MVFVVSVFTQSIVVYNNAYIKHIDGLYSKRVHTFDCGIQQCIHKAYRHIKHIDGFCSKRVHTVDCRVH